ncbi:MAG TPA: elongation factor Ts [Acidiferrobacteraceae bacterium]|nr:elongation factor Ts [Acidiferrobacteraceae bacterium]
MSITASMVKALRERSGAGMMECKKALAETQGDEDAALVLLRTKGEVQAEKKAGRIAAEGVIGSYASEDGKVAALVELNCETDFVAKEPAFKDFANALAQLAMDQNPADLDALLAMTLPGESQDVEAARSALINKIGENINIRRFVRFAAEADTQISIYLHGVRIGVLVESSGGVASLGRDIAMHIAASRPLCVSADQVPQESIEKEKAIFIAQAEESGKPPEIIEKMVSGKLRKHVNEVCLEGQSYVKAPELSVAKLLAGENAKVSQFVRFEVGEGIEKKVEDFAAEVMAQAKGG